MISVLFHSLGLFSSWLSLAEGKMAFLTGNEAEEFGFTPAV
jgi:hypothetical protein